MPQQKPGTTGETPDPADIRAALPVDGGAFDPDEGAPPVASDPEPSEEASSVFAASDPMGAPDEIVLGYGPPEEDLDEDEYVDEEPSGPSLLTRCAAEAFGSFFLVLAGVGVALYSAYDQVGSLAIGLAFGLAMLAGWAVVGHISGGHFNPAVTLGFAISGRTPWRDVLPYWLAQLIGGIVASSVLFLTVPVGLGALINKGEGRRGLFDSASNGFDAHSPLAHLLAASGVASEVTFGMFAALLIEAIGAAVFVGIFLMATNRRASLNLAPVVIGLTLAVVILVVLPITNASINPMRSTASAIFADTWALKQLWLFWVGPLLGGAIAGLLYRAFATPAEEEILVLEEEIVVLDDGLLEV